MIERKMIFVFAFKFVWEEDFRDNVALTNLGIGNSEHGIS